MFPCTCGRGVDVLGAGSPAQQQTSTEARRFVSVEACPAHRPGDVVDLVLLSQVWRGVCVGYGTIVCELSLNIAEFNRISATGWMFTPAERQFVRAFQSILLFSRGSRTTVPSSLAQFNNLTGPCDLRSCPSLVAVNVSHNKLSSCPLLPASVVSLKLGNNCISDTSPLARYLVNMSVTLRWFMVSMRSPSCVALEEAWLAHNSISSLPALLAGLSPLSSLKILIASDNPFVKAYDPDDMK
jgi:hypothetical protein